MEDTVGAAILGQSNVGARYMLPTGVTSEMNLWKDTQDTLATAEITTRDGDVKLKLKGKFPGCKGAVNLQVCMQRCH